MSTCPFAIYRLLLGSEYKGYVHTQCHRRSEFDFCAQRAKRQCCGLERHPIARRTLVSILDLKNGGKYEPHSRTHQWRRDNQRTWSRLPLSRSSCRQSQSYSRLVEPSVSLASSLCGSELTVTKVERVSAIIRQVVYSVILGEVLRVFLDELCVMVSIGAWVISQQKPTLNSLPKCGDGRKVLVHRNSET